MLSAKENARRLFHHEKAAYMPIFGDGVVNNTPVVGYCERPKGGRGGRDWFGVNWFWKEGDPAPMPVAPFLVEDIEDWKDAVRFPDLDDFDWEEAAAADRIPSFDRENNLLYQMIHNGLVERLQNVMAPEDAMCAYIVDPDSVREFFDALADYKCALIDKIARYYRPDIICYHDDWGTQRGLLFSPDTWREIVKEPTKRIVDHVHSKGIVFDLHCDGLIAEIVPEIVDDLRVDAINLMALNDIPALKKQTGDKVVYDMFIDTQKYTALESSGLLTEEAFREGIYNDVITCARGGNFIPNFILVSDEWRRIITEELRHVQRDLQKEQGAQ